MNKKYFFPYLAIWAILTIVISSSKLSHQTNYTYNISPPPLPNPRLQKAYLALQAWKHAITSDPSNFTSNWYAPNVCSYNGVYCVPAPDDPHALTVAGIDLNHVNLAGFLPEELGLLADLTLFHINTNRFCGTVPVGFRDLHLLYELDLSNNNFSGEFPGVVLCLRSIKYLDIRFNQFHGNLPPQLFDIKLDVLFVNDNKFESSLPETLGNSPVSVMFLANNDFTGCIPSSLSKMGHTINEIILANTGLTGCLQPDIASLYQVTVFDVSFNDLVGPLPGSMGNMKSLEQSNVAHNKLSGEIPDGICRLPKLENFTFSYNYFSGEPPACLQLPAKDDKENCLAYRPLQRSPQECASFYAYPVNCGAYGCSADGPPPPPWLPPPPVYDHYHYP